VRKLAGWLRPGGIVVFCSLVDAVAARSHLVGDETTMLEWERVLDEVARCSCVGAGLANGRHRRRRPGDLQADPYRVSISTGRLRSRSMIFYG
jgi:hypothetical protein